MKRDKTPPRPARDAAKRADAVAPADDLTLAQQRLFEAQSTIARDYTRLRELEARYRHLFETSGALVVVAGEGLRVLDANGAAGALLGIAVSRLVGSPLATALDPDAARAIAGHTDELLRGGSPRPLHLPAHGARPALLLDAATFRQDGEVVLMLHLRAEERASSRPGRDAPIANDEWERYAVAAPDGVVLTDLTGRVLQANSAFVELVQLATERQVRGESLGRWLGRTSVDLGVLVSNLRQRGTLKLFSTSLRAEYGTTTEVEISAALISAGDRSFLGFTIRDVGRRLAGDTRATDDLSRSVGQLAELVGRVPMKDIVGNTAELIEKMCIEAALQLTRDNRAAAAELLGLSRQSLYVKLRRYGLGDLGADEETEAA